MKDSPDWDTMFREVSRRRVGGGPKVTGAHEITWRGQIRGRRIDAVSRVRPINPMESFEFCFITHLQLLIYRQQGTRHQGGTHGLVHWLCCINVGGAVPRTSLMRSAPCPCSSAVGSRPR